VTQDVSHEFQFPRQGTKVHRIAPIDGPNMSNLGHRSKKVYGPNQGTIESLHA
jgi:3-dehydroquinate dehydratase II